MPRPKNTLPQLRAHISGQSYVRIDSRDYYLGKHGTPQSLARYAVLVAAYQSNDCSLPQDFDTRSLDARAGLLLAPEIELPPEYQAEDPITMKHVTAAYKAHAEEYYAADDGIHAKIRKVCDTLDKHSGNLEAQKFGPKLLADVRELWVNEGLCRNYVNFLTNLVFRIFRWAGRRELVPATAHPALKLIEPLQRGKTKARESKPVQAVDLETVRKTAKCLSPIVRDMLRVQCATGMRPSELCTMKPCEIDRSGDTWLYCPPKHKTAFKGVVRQIPIVGEAREVIENYINRPANAYVFCPKEAVGWHAATNRSERKTKVQPSQRNRAKKINPEVAAGDCYTRDSYRRAITRAAKTAGVPAWFPYQIRHAVGTAVADVGNLELSKALLGHSDIATTQRYAKPTIRQSIEAANSLPTIGDQQ